MKPTKSALVMILAAVLCFNSICTVFAAEESAEFKESQNIEMAGMDNIIMSGDCSATEDDHVTWALTGTDNEMVLSISGSGKMMGYEENQNSIPWWEKRNAINSVVINEGITNIGDEAFSYCINLTSVDLPEGLEEIGEEAFGSCKSLESITIPDSVISIGFGAFDACTNLKSINIPNNLNIIEDHVFAGCAFSSIDIPDSVTSIKCYAFTSCNNLTDVIIPDSVEIIEEFAFGDCSSLKSITIPDSVSSIGDFAFENCINLTSIMIPIDVTDIGNGVFNGCSNLLSIVVEEGNTNYCSSEGVLFNKNKTMLIEFPGGKNGVYSIPLTVTSVGDEAFYCCSNLTSVYFSGQAPSFGAGSFYNTVITAYFPENNASWTDSVKQNYGGEITWVPWAELSGICGDQVQWSISSDGTLEIRGYGPMYDYSSDSNDEKAPWDSYKTSITDILIGDGVTHIGSAAFFGCSNLESVSIAETVVSIGENAFSGSTSLGTVRYGGTKKQWENVSIGTGNNELKDAPSYVFIDGEEHNDPSEIASITPENGDENVDHSINRYIIQFKKDVEFTDEGYAYLFDSSNTSNPVETIALTSPSSKALLLSSIPGQHKQDIFQLMFQYKLEYGHHYYITIDKNALRFVTYDENIGDYVPTGKYFEGINGSAEWAFKICDIDYMHFNNPTDEILSSNYSILFKPLKAINIKAQDDGTHGTCFGWAYTVGAKEQSFYSISH